MSNHSLQFEAENLGKLIERRMNKLGLKIRLSEKMSFDKKRWRIFADWLKNERLNVGLSQERLGDLIDVDRQTIYRLENALSGTKRETVLALARALRSDESVALNKAGFADQEINESSHEVFEGVSVRFDNAKNTNEEQERLIELFRIVSLGASAVKKLWPLKLETLTFSDAEKVIKRDE